jgi:hypothetical protein
MRRVTITLTYDIEAALDTYAKRQKIPPVLTSVVQAALREYLARRSFSAPTKRLRISPAKKGSGRRDVSLRHDEYFALE